MKKFFAMSILALSLSGCAATHLAVSKNNLQVQTKTSASIFLDPVDAAQKTIYLQVRNRAESADFSLDQALAQALRQKDYRLVSQPSKAHYILQVHVLDVLKDAQTAGGDGGAFGAIAGGVIGGKVRDSSTAYLVGTLLGGLAESIVNATVKDVSYAVVVDVQIQEKTKRAARSTVQHRLKQGNSGHTLIEQKGSSNRLKYQTQIISHANQVNLTFEEAAPALQRSLVKTISAMF